MESVIFFSLLKEWLEYLEPLCPTFKDFVPADIPLRLIYSISKY